MKGITRKNLYLHLLDKQFNILEKCVEDALLDKNWAKEWSISPSQELKFRRYAISLIQGVLKINKAKAILAYSDFRKIHGLIIK